MVGYVETALAKIRGVKMTKSPKIKKWVEVPIRFLIKADSQELFDLALSEIPRLTWLDISRFGKDGEYWCVMSEAATKRR